LVVREAAMRILKRLIFSLFFLIAVATEVLVQEPILNQMIENAEIIAQKWMRINFIRVLSKESFLHAIL
jgi:hypothetical protein